MKVVFMGTPDFAVPTLKALYDNFDVKAVFTQPDKPKGRGYKLTPPPVKVVATKHDTPVYQPQSFKKGEDAKNAVDVLNQIQPDFIVVVAYGKLLPKEVLEIPKFACINVHASLLPKYRGAGPIQWSVLNDEKETGVTTMLMAEGLDTGDMLLKQSTKIGLNETASELHDRLSEIGAEILIKTIQNYSEIVPKKQDDSKSCYAPMLSKDMCQVDFSLSAREVHKKICGLSDWPCAVAYLGEKRIKIYKSELISENDENANFGEILDKNKFIVACKKGSIKICEIQEQGSKRMKAEDYLRGHSLSDNTVLK